MKTKQELGQMIDLITDLLERAAAEADKPEEEQNLHQLAIISFTAISALSVISLHLIELVPNDK